MGVSKHSVKVHLIITLLICCSGSISAQSLRSDSIANAALTSHELAAYDALVVFAEVTIGCNTTKISKTNCWELFLTSAIDHSSGAVNIPWDLKGQQGFIGKINLGELTDSIWSTSRKANFTENDSLENFSLNFEGCLGSLYSMAANNCEDWTDTWSAIEVTGGDLPPSLAH